MQFWCSTALRSGVATPVQNAESAQNDRTCSGRVSRQCFVTVGVVVLSESEAPKTVHRMTNPW